MIVVALNVEINQPKMTKRAINIAIAIKTSRTIPAIFINAFNAINASRVSLENFPQISLNERLFFGNILLYEK